MMPNNYTSSPRYNSRQGHKAFTLTEIMITITILGFVSIGLASFLLDSTTGMFWATKKSQITKDVRIFTLRISKETLDARTAVLYPSFTKTDRDTTGDKRQSGQTGDCLVLISYDPYPNIEDPAHYTKLVVFFRKASATGVSPVYRTEIEFETPQPIVTTNVDGTDDPDHFERFLATHFPEDAGDFPIVLELSRGLANGNLFRDLDNDTYVINGEILHGNKIKEVTNTYNLTISPRG